MSKSTLFANEPSVDYCYAIRHFYVFCHFRGISCTFRCIFVARDHVMLCIAVNELDAVAVADMQGCRLYLMHSTNNNTNVRLFFNWPAISS